MRESIAKNQTHVLQTKVLFFTSAVQKLLVIVFILVLFGRYVQWTRLDRQCAWLPLRRRGRLKAR
jgi:hypothetical protein